jgi:hypothetical protein
MARRWLGLVFGVAGLVPLPAPASAQIAGVQNAVSAHRELVTKYCITCHNERMRSGGLVLDGLDPGDVAAHRPVWEKVVRKMRAGMMPPPGRPRPAREAYDAFAAALEDRLDAAAARTPDPGRTETLHRLNRAQYHNAVRDLLALDVDVMSLLPADDASYGFDNIAGVLKVNQTRLERYLAAARKVAREAVGGPMPLASTRFPISPELPQYERVEGLPFGTRGGTLIHHHFPQDGEYALRIDLTCPVTRGGDVNCDGAGGFPEPYELEVLVDGARAGVFNLPSRPRWERYNFQEDANDVKVLGDIKEDRFELRVPVKAGPRAVGVTFVKRASVEVVQRGYRRLLEKPMSSGAEGGLVITVPHLRQVTISGPFDPSGPGDTPSRRAVFTCRPQAASEEPACARAILARLARRAFRRPVTDQDVDKLFAFYTQARTEGEGFEQGIERGIRRLLMSADFLVRVSADPPDAVAGASYAVAPLELASRLSFFLWNSIPDEELIDTAARGRLREPAVLERQVRRMLADPRAESLTKSFAAQWLLLQDLGGVKPSPFLFPDFDESLRRAMQRETELFLDDVVRSDRSVTWLLTADATFVNDRLARHYGIPNVQGSHFRRVTLGADHPRRGLLGQGSILTLTSHANRTSPVKRGKWILENILGTPPPPPPANVPPLPEKKGEAKVLSMREQMAAHRANPVCASCHAMIDPAGFALENFDPIGRYRRVDEDIYAAIDASGTLPDGAAFSGLEEFRRALVARPERFVATLTEKLLIYALGRGIEPSDMPTVRAIVKRASREGYRFSSVILGLVGSPPFQMRRAAAIPPPNVAAVR